MNFLWLTTYNLQPIFLLSVPPPLKQTRICCPRHHLLSSNGSRCHQIVINIVKWKSLSSNGNYPHQIEKATLHNVCSVPWRYHEYRGDIMSTVGISSVPWEILGTIGDIMMHVGDIMSTMEVFSFVGGYNLLLFEYLHNTEHFLRYS